MRKNLTFHCAPSSRLCRAALLLCCALVSARLGRAAEDPAGETRAQQAEYFAELHRLADWCRERKLPAEAKTTEELAARPDPYKLVLPVLPQQIGSLLPPATASGDSAEWRRRLLKLRQGQAAALFMLAQRAARLHQGSLAYSLALDALRADPDHEAARRVFGFQKHQGQWRRPYELGMLRAGMVWHEKFGWLEKGSLPRYLAGQRLLGVTWIDAADDAKLHAEINNGWDIETEHYRIRTNHSIEAAVALGGELETLYRIWRQVFLSYYATEANIEALFSERPSPARRSPPLEVVYFRDKQQYHRTLRPQMPDVAVSMGLYVAENRTAYFYAGSEDTRRTTYHEATHQLFQQSRPTRSDAGQKANCWLMEGVAMYMETLRREGDGYVLGGLDDSRVEAARYHLEKNDFYVPFDKLARLGVQDLQNHPQIARLYSQIAGMTCFLMHFDEGRYRAALICCLADIYNGSQDPELLARATGDNYAELDRQYRSFMKILPGK